jgi:hypothetical protein
MALEFKTKDESYKGHRHLPSGTTIWRAKIFVDTLPPGFPANNYSPVLIPDRHSNRPRYVIKANILINRTSFVLSGILTAGVNITPQETIQRVMNNSIERNGLDIILVHQDCEYQGVLHPMPEATAEARHPPLPPFVTRQRRHP